MNKTKKPRPAKPVDYGRCAWIWVRIGRKWRWVPAPAEVLNGTHCRLGATAPDPNELRIKGKRLLDLLLVSCKPIKAQDGNCGSCFCVYKFDGSIWVPDQNYPPCNNQPCKCTDPNPIVGIDERNMFPLSTQCITWCQ